MTDVLSRMLNDPMTRAALSAGGEDSLDPGATERQRQLSEESSTSRRPSESLDPAQENVQEEDHQMDTAEVQPVTTSAPAEIEEPDERNEACLVDSSVEERSEMVAAEPEASTSSLSDHLSSLRHLRHGFIEQTGSEPSVSLKYSLQGSSMSTISLQVGNDMVSENFSNNEDGEDSTVAVANDANMNVAGKYIWFVAYD